MKWVLYVIDCGACKIRYMIELLRIDVARLALEQTGRPAVNHAKLAGCAFGETGSECMRLGMDKDGYDCSGLVIASLAAVIGVRARDWPQSLRHVRQMYEKAETAEVQLRPGDLPVFARYYNFGSDKPRQVPGHIGIVINADWHTGRYEYVHTNADTGRVEAVQSELGNSSPEEEILGVVSPWRLAAIAHPSCKVSLADETVYV